MIYALNAEGLSYEDEADGVLEYADEAAAEDAFREYVTLHRPSRRYASIWEMYLFHTREDAEAANPADEDSAIDEGGKAFRILDWENGFGFNF